MTYTRVIPRDLFNEADLLKCYGRLSILLDQTSDHAAQLIFDEGEEGEPFRIEQDDSSGAISVSNVLLIIGGEPQRLFRPLNARSKWPLWCEGDGDDLRVFTDEGNLSDEFLALIKET